MSQRNVAAEVLALTPLIVMIAAGWIGMGIPAVRARLRARVERRPVEALVPALVLMLGAILYQIGTGTHDAATLGKALAYWTVPLLLAGFRRREPDAVTVRDYAALAASFLPVHLHWLGPPGHLLAEAIPAATVPLGIFYLVTVRGLADPGYTFRWTARDVAVGTRNFVIAAVVLIPLALWLDFARFSFSWARLARFPLTFLIVLPAIAVPEELLFRGFLQSMLERTLRSAWLALTVASLAFGAAHWNHFHPQPNWTYVFLASLAGIAYGCSYRVRWTLPAPALTHTLVDVTWFLFFMKPGGPH